MILANGCNITKSEKFKGVWIFSVPTVYIYIYIYMSDDINKQSAHDTEYVVVFFSYISDI